MLSGDASRQMFWIGLMHNGAAGGTYGANGIWQVNRRDAPYGPSPHGRSWGSIPWDEAMHRPSSTQVGLAKQFFARYPWHRLEPRPEAAPGPTISRPKTISGPRRGDGDESADRLCPASSPVLVKQLAPQADYAVSLFDPVTGGQSSLGKIRTDENGAWQGPSPAGKHDWVLVLERSGEPAGR